MILTIGVGDEQQRRPPRVPRVQTVTERDFEGIRARQERAAAVVTVVEEDITGNYEGEELQRRRALRDPDPSDRVGRLEHKHDKLVAEVAGMRGTLGELKGGIETLVKMGAASEAERERRSKQEADDRRLQEERKAATELRLAEERARRRLFVLRLIPVLAAAIAVVLAAILTRGH